MNAFEFIALTAVVSTLFYLIYNLACFAATHEHQPPVHPNGRCPICGLDPQETR